MRSQHDRPGHRIRGASHDPGYNPEKTIGDDLDEPPRLDMTPDQRLF